MLCHPQWRRSRYTTSYDRSCSHDLAAAEKCRLPCLSGLESRLGLGVPIDQSWQCSSSLGMV